MAAITGPNNQSTDCKRCILLLRTIPQLRERERQIITRKAIRRKLLLGTWVFAGRRHYQQEMRE